MSQHDPLRRPSRALSVVMIFIGVILVLRGLARRPNG
jgi:hypothetical protein